MTDDLPFPPDSGLVAPAPPASVAVVRTRSVLARVSLAVLLTVVTTVLPLARSDAETMTALTSPLTVPPPPADGGDVGPGTGSDELAPQIVGGTNATQVPTGAVALIWFNNPVSSCTGVLVAPQWVLTAAHCLVSTINNRASLNDVTTYQIRLGVASGAAYSSVSARRADLLVLNDGYMTRSSADDVPGYRSDTTGLWVPGTANLANELGLDDFGLIRLESPVLGVTPVPLALDDSLYQRGQQVWAAGWGLTSGGGSIPSVLQEAPMTVQSTSVCEISWRQYFSATSNVCYRGTTTATCNGDSGGPIMSRDERGQWWIVAVVTGGPANCPVDRPYVGVRGAWMASFVSQQTGVPQLGRTGESLNPIVPVRIVDSRTVDVSQSPPGAVGFGVDYIPQTIDDPRVLGIYKPVPVLPNGFVVRRPFFAQAQNSTSPTATSPVDYRVPGLPTAGGLAGVVLNVTVDQTAGPGFLTVYPCADGRPATSNLNYVGGQTVANLVVTKVDRNGDVCFLTSNQAALIVDVVGWLGPAGTDRSLLSATPVRVKDTRLTGGRLVGGGPALPLGMTVSTAVGFAPSNATGVVLSVTATRAAGLGFVQAWPCDAVRPTASTMNPIPGRDVSNAAVVKLSAAGTVCFYSSTDTDLVVDINGWLVPGAGTVKTMSPQRVLDSRSPGGTPLGANVAREVTVLGVGGVPATGVNAVALNVTIVGPAASGYAVVYPCGTVAPLASNVNYTLGQTTPNAVVANVAGAAAAAGKVCVLANQPADLLVDVTGYVLTSS